MTDPDEADALALAEEAARREADAAVHAEPADAARVEGAGTRVQRAVLGGIAADRVTVGQGVVGGVMASDVSIDRGVVGGILADRVSVVQGGAARIVGGDVSVDQGGGGLIAGWNVRLGRGSFAGAVLAARVEGEVRALLDWRGVLAASLAILGIAWLRRRR
jgi:hypothetical protein